MSRLNLVHQLSRFALRRYQVKPAARDHQIRRHAQHPIRNRIAMMMVVEEPCVDVAFPERSLDSRKVHGPTSIVNNGKEFGRIEGSKGQRLGYEVIALVRPESVASVPPVASRRPF